MHLALCPFILLASFSLHSLCYGATPNSQSNHASIKCKTSIADLLSEQSVILSYLLTDNSADDLQFQSRSAIIASQSNKEGVEHMPHASSTHSHYTPVDEMLQEPHDGLPSSSILSDPNFSSRTSAPPSNPTAPSLSPSHQRHVPSAGKARRNKIKRAKWKEKSKHKGIQLKSLKKGEASATRLAARLAGAQGTVASPFSVSSLPKNRSGFGASLRNADKEQAACLSDDLDYFREVVRSLRPVPYNYSQRSVTDFRDRHGIRFGLRAFRDHRMDERFMEQLVRQIDEFATACGIQPPSEKHPRGDFAQALFGYNHGMGAGKQEPYRHKFHQQHMEEIDQLLGSTEMQLVIQIATELLDLYFPGVASLCRDVDAFWHENGLKHPRMDFGLFYNMAINVDMGRRVKSVPHRDKMNLAWGICAILAFGFFHDGQLAWLVNLEAGIVIQIPSGVFYFCLSSIITHFNVDRHEFWAGENRLDFVVTERWERPNAFNTKPLHSIQSGRGSIVLYNQATAFHWMLTGENGIDAAASKYGGFDRLAEAMAVEAQRCLSACDA